MRKSSNGNHKFDDCMQNQFTKYPSALKRRGTRDRNKPFALTDVVDVDFEDVDEKAQSAKSANPDGFSGDQRQNEPAHVHQTAFLTMPGRLNLFNGSRGHMRCALG